MAMPEVVISRTPSTGVLQMEASCTLLYRAAHVTYIVVSGSTSTMENNRREAESFTLNHAASW